MHKQLHNATFVGAAQRLLDSKSKDRAATTLVPLLIPPCHGVQPAGCAE